MRFQSIAAITAFGAFVLALAVALTASFGTRAGLWDYHFGIFLLEPAVAVGALGVISGAAWLISALARNSGSGAMYGIIGLAGAILVVAIPLDEAWRARISPPIHDISTDIEYAPQFKALLPLRKSAANGPDYDGPKKLVYQGKHTTVSALQKKFYQDVIPFVAFGKPIKLYWRAMSVVNSLGWHVVAADPTEGRIEATDTSFWFGFTDDIVIRIRPAGKLGARLDIRSKSRVGESDLGANARHIREFIKGIKATG